MLTEFEVCHKATEATKYNCCAEGEGEFDNYNQML